MDCESVRFSCYVSLHEWNTNITSTYHRTLTVSKTRPTLVVIYKHYEWSTVAFKALKYKIKITRNSAIADKPRHEFVQYATTLLTTKTRPSPSQSWSWVTFSKPNQPNPKFLDPTQLNPTHKSLHPPNPTHHRHLVRHIRFTENFIQQDRQTFYVPTVNESYYSAAVLINRQ